MPAHHSPSNPGPREAGVRVQTQTTVETRTLRIAPLPTVSEFAGYEAVLPGAAGRIMRQAERMTDLAERQQTHRFGLENRVVDGNLKSQNTGMWIGGVLSMVVVIGGIILLMRGLPVEGLIGILTPLAVLAGVFVYGKNQQVQQLAEKRAADIVQASPGPGTGVARR